ncbi:MAG TPA: phosphate ABC transporter substrate-binding protein [Conexibacter sp.]|nr:phosphate ABC transporter substrate-binding protein [Conexibacter sp.]
MLRRSTTLAALATVAALALAAPAALAKTTITMSGSTSVAPLVRALAIKYVALHPGKVGFKLQQGGSDIGINDVAHGRVTIGNASRKPQPSDPGGLVFNRIAYDAICVITSTANPLPGLSQAQVQSIFTGRTRSWSQVPGARVHGAIDIFTRTATSGTADAFRAIFLGNTLSVAASAPAKSSNGLVNQSVRTDNNAIGFVSLDFLRGVRAIPYQGVACTLRNAKSGQYQGIRPFSLVTRGAATGAAKAFIGWVQHSAAARAIINTHWIPLG